MKTFRIVSGSLVYAFLYC